MITRLRQWWAQGPGRGDVLGINRRNLDFVFADYTPGKFRDLDDKLAAKKVLEAVGVPVPRTLGVVRGPRDWPVLDDLLANHDSMVIKPANGWGGRGILVLNKCDEQWQRPGQTPVSAAEIRTHLSDVLSGIYSLDEENDAAIVEELIRPHAFFASIGPTGLCDLRIVLEDGQPVQAMCRVPTQASDGKANLHGGGVGLGIDLVDGRVNGAVVNDQRVTRHPDTGQPLLGLQMPLWPACLDLAVAASQALDVRYVGVDIVVDQRRGPLILEVNARPGLAIQIANAQPQPVSPPVVGSRWDRATNLINWILLACLALSPLGYHWWQNKFTEAIVVDVTARQTHATLTVEPEPTQDEAASSTAVQFEEVALTESSATFAAARAATAAGDIVRAKTLYQSALSDSALAPFALNNLAVLARRAGRDSLALDYLQEAIDRYPEYQRGYYNLSLILADQRQTAAARLAFQRSLDLKPNHAGSWLGLGALEFDAGNLGVAEQALLNAIRYRPTGTRARLKLGLCYRLQGKMPAAAAMLTELVALDPEHEPGAYWLARTCRDLVTGAAADSRDYVVRTRQLLETFASRTPRLESMRGELAYLAGDLARARSVFAALSQTSYRPGYHNLALAATTLQLGDWDAAAGLDSERAEPEAAGHLSYLARLAQAVSDPNVAVPNPAAATTPLADLVASYLTGDHRRISDALAAWEAANGPGQSAWVRWLVGRGSAGDRDRALDLPQAIKGFTVPRPALDDHHAVSQTYAIYLGYALAVRNGDNEAAARCAAVLQRTQPDFLPLLRRDFGDAVGMDERSLALDLGERLLELGYADPHFMLELAEVARLSGKYRTARRLLRSTAAPIQETPAAVVLAAHLDIRAGKTDQAVASLRRLVDRAPTEIEARFALGQAQLAAGRKRRSEQELRAALDLDPSRLDIRRALARVLMKRNKYGLAAHEWSILLTFVGDDASERFSYALCLQRSGDNEAALREYDTVLRLSPDRTSAVFNRGLALIRLGRDAEARDSFKHMLELIPSHEPSLKKLAELEGKNR